MEHNNNNQLLQRYHFVCNNGYVNETVKWTDTGLTFSITMAPGGKITLILTLMCRKLNDGHGDDKAGALRLVRTSLLDTTEVRYGDDYYGIRAIYNAAMEELVIIRTIEVPEGHHTFTLQGLSMQIHGPIKDYIPFSVIVDKH